MLTSVGIEYETRVLLAYPLLIIGFAIYVSYLIMLHKRLLDAGINKNISSIIVVISFFILPIGIISLISGLILPTKNIV